jgi:ATP-dependent RNA helicase RhlE
VDDDDKRHVIRQILRDRDIKQSIVFVNSKLGAARLARTFERDGLRTTALHGDKSQDERMKALDAFKRGEFDLLVATDVAARGIDIAALPAVFNYDIPFNAEDYVHRIGRTGRAGASGLAVSLVTGADARLMGDIEKLLKSKPEIETFELERNRRSERSTSERGDRDSYRREAREGDGESRPRANEAREEREPRPVRAAPQRRQPSDPFFDKPYEADPSADPTWDTMSAVAQAASTGGSGLSRFLKPKRKVAALLGGTGTVRR